MMSSQEVTSLAARRSICPAALASELPLFAQASSEAEDGRDCGGAEERIAWTDEEIVQLHGILFDTCIETLHDSETPLDEVLDCLRWIFSAPGKEGEPFSFAATLKLYGRPHARFVREAIQAGLARYLKARLARYPAWVAEAFWSDPDWFAEELERNPQWVNETLRRHSRDGDLFAV